MGTSRNCLMDTLSQTSRTTNWEHVNSFIISFIYVLFSLDDLYGLMQDSNYRPKIKNENYVYNCKNYIIDYIFLVLL